MSTWGESGGLWGSDAYGSTFADVAPGGDFDAGDIDFDGDVDFDASGYAAAGSFPLVTVWIAPGYLMTDTSKEWVDITSVVLQDPGITISNGRSSESESDSTAELTLTLRDLDRTYDPLNTLGPYVGKLVPWMPIRVVATYANITYALFVGGVRAFPQEYAVHDKFVTIPLIAHGWLGWLANKTYTPANPWILDDPTAGMLDGNRMISSADLPVYGRQTSGARIAALADLAGVPAEYLDADGGLSDVGVTDATGLGLFEHLGKVVKTELGRLFEANDGALTYADRHSTEAETTTAFFSDAGGWSVPYSFLSIDPADARTWINLATRGSKTLGDATALDQVSIDRFGQHDDTDSDLLYADRGDMVAQSGHLVGRYAYPTARITSIEVKPRRSPEYLFPVVCGVGLTDRFLISRQPLGTGASFTAEGIVDRITHTIMARDWVTTYELHAPDPGNYWTLDDPALGMLDAGNMIGY